MDNKELNPATMLGAEQKTPEGVLPEGVGYSPGITQVKVHFGLNSKTKQPDPNKIICYEMPDGSFIETHNGNRVYDKPHYLDFLSSRPVMADERDIAAAIMHGVLEDGDYEHLDKAGLVPDLCKGLWDKTKKIKELMKNLEYAEQLSKSEEEPSLEVEPTPQEMPVSRDLTTEDVARIFAEVRNGGSTSGDDIVKDIVDIAMAESKNSIRAVVLDVLKECGLLPSAEPSSLATDSLTSLTIDQQPPSEPIL